MILSEDAVYVHMLIYGDTLLPDRGGNPQMVETDCPQWIIARYSLADGNLRGYGLAPGEPKNNEISQNHTPMGLKRFGTFSEVDKQLYLSWYGTAIADSINLDTPDQQIIVSGYDEAADHLWTDTFTVPNNVHSHHLAPRPRGGVTLTLTQFSLDYTWGHDNRMYYDKLPTHTWMVDISPSGVASSPYSYTLEGKGNSKHMEVQYINGKTYLLGEIQNTDSLRQIYPTFQPPKSDQFPVPFRFMAEVSGTDAEILHIWGFEMLSFREKGEPLERGYFTTIERSGWQDSLFVNDNRTDSLDGAVIRLDYEEGEFNWLMMPEDSFIGLTLRILDLTADEDYLYVNTYAGVEINSSQWPSIFEKDTRYLLRYPLWVLTAREEDASHLPLPVENHLAQDGMLNLSADEPSLLQVFDISGRLVLSQGLHAGINSIELSGVVQGIYPYSLSSDGKTLRRGMVLVR